MPATMSLYFTVEAESEDEAMEKVFEVDFQVTVTGEADLGEFEMVKHVTRGNVTSAVLNSYDIAEAK